MADRVGQRLDNYQLVRIIGSGTFGEVYLAEHIYQKNIVAIKVLPKMADSELPAFLNEARSIRLKHPHIIQISDFGFDDRIPFIVMDYAQNGTLRERHPRGTRVPIEAILSYINQIASALDYAHSERIIHRDIKPENLLLNSKNEVLVSDFGIATIAHSSRSQITQEMAGTVSYMAPEQIQGKPRLASDQYALGIIVYEWLCGERPFNGAVMEIAMQHMLAPPPLLREKLPGIPPKIEQVIMIALEKDPKNRFTSVQAFANALEQGYREQQVQLTLPVPVVSPSALPQQQEKAQSQAVVLPSERSHATPSIESVVARQDTSLPPIEHARNDKRNPTPTPLPIMNKTSTPNGIKPELPLEQRIFRRPPIFYPTLALFMLLLLSGLAGSLYYLYLHNKTTDIDTHLQHAQTMINLANNETKGNQINPTDALQRLSVARTDLLMVQIASRSSTQDSQFIKLQTSYVAAAQTAITAYNLQAKIVQVPCSNNITQVQIGSGSGGSNGTTGTQATSIASIKDQSNNVFSYALGANGTLYQLNQQGGLTTPMMLNGPIQKIASDGVRILALTASKSTPISYSLHLLIPDPAKTNTGILKDINAATIDTETTAGGNTPTAITAWGPDVYIIVAPTTTSSTASVLDYAIDTNINTLNRPFKTQFSYSHNIVSAAAYPDHQLFLLGSDGSILSLNHASGNGTKNSQSQTTSVLLTQPIRSPLPISANEYTSFTQAIPPIPVPSPKILSLSNASLLITGLGADNKPHLYVADSHYHRILDFTAMPNPFAGSATNTPIATPSNSANTGGGVASSTPTSTSTTMNLEQQYTSKHLFATVNSFVAHPQDARLYLLALDDRSPASLNLITMDMSQNTSGCKPTP